MANSGYTTTTALSDSLNTVVAEARIVREYEGVMPQLVDKYTLKEGDGLTWNEVALAQLVANAVSESEEYDNAQQLSDTMLSVTPTVAVCQTIITDRVAKRIAKVAYAKLGQLCQNAIQRKKDEDGLTVLDGATTTLCGSGSTLASGHIAAGAARIRGNTTEGAPDPVRCVLHPYQIKDLYDELVAGVGSYVVNEGPTATVLKSGFTLPISGVEIYSDGNVPIDGTPDATGGMFAKMGILLVQGRSPWTATERKQIGGGADSVWLYDEYAYGERSSGNWVYEVKSDATAPTS